MASLFGIDSSSRDFNRKDSWGKNQFNSAFPISLACFMHSQHLGAVYVKHNGSQHNLEEISIEDAFRLSTYSLGNIFFDFESRFEPFISLVSGSLDKIDVVVRDKYLKPIAPIEIKLTVIPDNSTHKLSERQWGPEIVFRSPTLKYVCLSILDTIREMPSVRAELHEALVKASLQVRNWKSKFEVMSIMDRFREALLEFANKHVHLQKPLLLQPIWKTEGKVGGLAENCFDLFVWSDFALVHLCLDQAVYTSTKRQITRQQRAMMRIGRYLMEGCHAKVNEGIIFDEMTYDLQNDKEFALNGTVMARYLKSDYLFSPRVHRSSLKDIILDGGEQYLSPERRLDSAIVSQPELFR